RRRRRNHRRRPAGRPGRDSSAACEARRGLRPRLRLEGPSPRPALPARALADLQLGDGPRFRLAAARPQLWPEGLPRRGRQRATALRRAAPLHSGARVLPRIPNRRAGREPPPARARTLALRGRTLRARFPRPADRLVHRPLPLPAAPPLRRVGPPPPPPRPWRSL